MKAVIRNISLITGVLFAIYGVVVISLIGTGNIFNFFFLLSGGMLVLFSAFAGRMSETLFHIISAFLILALITFLILEAMIIGYGLKKAENGADYVIVLGSQIRSDGPSIDYRARLDNAYAYLKENPDTMVIVTGAQGENEPVSEAEGGKDYLIRKGLDENRILIEDESYDTLQNLNNAKAIIEKRGGDITVVKTVIISAVYHLYRASYIAGKLGFGNVSCRGGHGLYILLPQYFTREFFAMVRQWFVLR